MLENFKEVFIKFRIKFKRLHQNQIWNKGV